MKPAKAPLSKPFQQPILVTALIYKYLRNVFATFSIFIADNVKFHVRPFIIQLPKTHCTAAPKASFLPRIDVRLMSFYTIRQQRKPIANLLSLFDLRLNTTDKIAAVRRQSTHKASKCRFLGKNGAAKQLFFLRNPTRRQPLPKSRNTAIDQQTGEAFHYIQRN